MPHILIYERTSLFTAELQRSFNAIADVQVRWAPHLIDFKSQARFASLVLMHVEELDLKTLDLVQELKEQTSCPWLLLLKDQAPELEWTLRELGADAVLLDTVQKSRLIELVKRMVWQG